MAFPGTYGLDKLKTLLSQEVLNTVQTYFELKIVKEESTTLYLFLDNRIHELFHYFVHQIPCCNTQSPCTLATKQRTLTKEQFSLLYKNDPTIQPIHEKKNKGRVVQHCICPLSPNNATDVIDLDLTLINCLIKTCRRTPAGNPKWLKDIKEVRNCLSHVGDDSSVQDQDVHDWWIKLENAAVNLANTIGVAYKKGVERRISEMRASQSQFEELVNALKERADDFEQRIANSLQNIGIRVGDVPFNVTATEFLKEKPQISIAAPVSLSDKGTKKCIVVWTFSNPGNWDVEQMKEKLELLKRIGDFDIEFVYQGSLVIHTVADINIISDERRFKDSIEEFLFLFVQLLVIQEPKAASFDVALSIWLPQLDGANQGEEPRETVTEQFSSAQCPLPKSSIDDIKPSLLKTYNLSQKVGNTFVTGCDLLPNGDFVIADQAVRYVKYYDNKGVLKKKIKTEPRIKPIDVCFINNNTIAVSTSYDDHENILFVNITDNKVIKKVNVGLGDKMLYFDQVLVVGISCLSSSKILVIDPDKNFKNVIKTDEISGVFASNKMIYYTEWRKHAVVRCDESGDNKWRYKDPSIKFPNGIVVDQRNFIFVACGVTRSVIAISPDGKNSRVILSPDQGLNLLYALAFNSKDRTLMVCNRDDGNVFLYQL